MRLSFRVILGFAAILFVGAAAFIAMRHISAPRIIADAIAPDGTRMCVVQQFNWSGEPFTTSFVFRRPGGTWGRFYYDHQDNYWSRSRVAIDTNRSAAVFYRGDSPAVTFAWETETYTMHRWNRTISGAQWMSSDWQPNRSVYLR